MAKLNDGGKESDRFSTVIVTLNEVDRKSSQLVTARHELLVLEMKCNCPPQEAIHQLTIVLMVDQLEVIVLTTRA